MNENPSKIESSKLVPLSEREKTNTEMQNYKEHMKHLAEKFSGWLQDEPITVYTQYTGFPANSERKFDQIKEVHTDRTGSGGSIDVFFDRDNYISVNKDKYSGNSQFSPTADYYKITKESFYNISRMMDELIRDSGYTEVEKTKMSKMVIDALKNKIVDGESLEK